MIRYRIIQKDIVCEGMTEDEAREALMQIKDSRPAEIFDVEEYNWIPQLGRLGRDPDLH